MNPDAAALRVFERKVLYKILAPVRVGDNFHIRCNSALNNANNVDVVQRINYYPAVFICISFVMER